MNKKKIQFKAKKTDQWEDAVTELINSKENVSFYPKDGEILLSINGSDYRSIILSKDGTWRLD